MIKKNEKNIIKCFYNYNPMPNNNNNNNNKVYFRITCQMI